ncbi:MAG TPA: hypothetical protein PKA82_15330 [Pyrinomonadaceae bacterium]|nr:hypothetical protein [Pyrinomonadaceae bacterium]
MKVQLIFAFAVIVVLVGNIAAQRGVDPGAGESMIRQADSEIKEFGSGERKNSIANGGERLGKLFGTYKSAKELYDAQIALGKGECAPDFSVDPQAMVPSSCWEVLKGRSAKTDTPISTEPNQCATCYDAAYKKLNDVRKRLAKLKCLGNSTKSYVTAAQAFGDNVSSVHAVQGLAWQRQRKEITDAYTKFKAAYDAKYKELMTTLVDAMNDVAACEAKNGNPDWFQRFGFMYVEFMAEKYKRVD